MSHHVHENCLIAFGAAEYYSIIADEATDQTRQHQLGISIRWVDEQFAVNEDFLALAHLPSGDAGNDNFAYKGFLCRSSLDIKNCRGQCYDGEASWLDINSGVSKRIAFQLKYFFGVQNALKTRSN